MTADNDQSSAPHAAQSAVDVLSDVLRNVRLTGAMLFLVDAATPWHSWAPRAEAFRAVVLPQCEHIVSYHIVVDGNCWAGLRGAPPVPMQAGDTLVIAHGDAYCLAEPADAQATYDITRAVQFFRTMAAGELPSVVVEGGGGATTARFICGFLGCDRRPFNPVLATLPPLLHLRGADERMRRLVDFAAAALREPRGTGAEGVLLRLAELMFVEVLRRHLDSPGEAHRCLAGLRDPLIARALAALHGAPARGWTLESLAGAVGASRTVLAERFTQLVGMPPMHYLTHWRMQLAARLLADGVKVRTAADAIGYESEAAFSRAFKKAVGCAPASWRQRRHRPM